MRFHDVWQGNAIAQERGGIARSHRAATLPAGTPDQPLESVADVLSLLEKTANAVRRGELEPRLANCLAYISTVALNGLSQCAPSGTASVVQFLVVPPSGIAPCPSCQEGKDFGRNQLHRLRWYWNAGFLGDSEGRSCSLILHTQGVYTSAMGLRKGRTLTSRA
jgi:hypothetical protein